MFECLFDLLEHVGARELRRGRPDAGCAEIETEVRTAQSPPQGGEEVIAALGALRGAELSDPSKGWGESGQQLCASIGAYSPERQKSALGSER